MRRTIPVLVAVLLLVATLPGTAAAATRSGGTVTVGPDETVAGDLQAFGGTVVIEGTVTGDVEAFGGTVVIDGTVDGNVEAAGGTVEITGTVGGDVDAAGGTVEIGDDARIEGNLGVGASSVTLDGTVLGDAEIGAERVTLGPDARIDGSLTYDGALDRADGATVGGPVTRSDSVDAGPSGPGLALPDGAFTVYGVLVNLLAGAVLLVAFPRFSTTVADGVADDPLRSGGVGLLALVVVPLVCAVLLVTVVGIPLSIVGFLAYLLLVWAGALYGRFAAGRALLARAGRHSRWLALLVGVLGVAVLKLVPILGDLVEAALVLAGLGALVTALRARYRGDEEPEAVPEPPAGDADPA